MSSILRSHRSPRLVLLFLALTLGLFGSVAPTFATTPATHWTTFSYDTLGRVTQTTYPDGTQTRACYDVGVTVEIDANQHKTRTTRDASGRVVKVEEYTGTYTTCRTARGTPYATTTYTYDRLGNLLTVTDALGNKTTLQYDTLSRKTQMRDPDLGTWRYTYDLNGNLTRQTDARNQQIHFRYDGLNRRVQKDYGTQKAVGAGDVRYTYDGSKYRRQGRLAHVVDGSGTTAFRYDAAGRVTRTDKTVDSVTYTTQTAYDGLGRVTALTYPQAPRGAVGSAVGTQQVTGVLATVTARAATQDFETLAGAGNTNPMGLWSDGTTLWVVDWGEQHVYAYDLATQVRQPAKEIPGLKAAGNTRPRGVWSDGTTLWISNQWDDTLYAYDLASQARVKAQDITGLAAAGNVAAVGLWGDGTTLWVADSDTDKIYAYDLATKTRKPAEDFETLAGAGNTSPTGIWSDGTTLWVADRGDDKVYAYDLVTKARTPAQDVDTLAGVGNTSPQGLWGVGTTLWVADSKGGKLYAYGGVAGLTGLTLASSWTPEADNAYAVQWSVGDGRMWEKAIQTPAGVTQTVTFTEPQPQGPGHPQVGDQITILASPRAAPAPSTVTYTYTGPHLQSVQEGSTTYARYSGFNAVGQPSTLTLGNGTTTTYTYDTRNYRLTTLTTQHGPTTLQNLGYTYDSGGNVTSITDPRHGTQTYTYDALDRLTGAMNGVTGGYGTITYTYNQIGNLTYNSKVGTYTYPASGTSSARPHAVTRAGSQTYRYDANGNLVSGGGRTLTWDAENRPTQIVKDGVTTTFGYDGDGGRVKKTVQGTTTVYIGQLFVCEASGCAKLIYAGDQRLAMVQVASGSTSYFHADHLGSTSVLTDASGTAEEHNSYQPYGKIATHTGTSDVAYKYTGQERDASADLYFYQARYYDQGLGRFVSPDPIVPNVLDPQAFNRYAYARNNPVRYVDPTGYAWNDWLDWGPWDVPDFGWGPWDNPGFGDDYWNPPTGPIDNPVTGVPMLDEVLVQATPLPPESWFLDFLGRDPWGFDIGIPPVSDPLVTLVGGEGGTDWERVSVTGLGNEVGVTILPLPATDGYNLPAAYKVGVWASAGTELASHNLTITGPRLFPNNTVTLSFPNVMHGAATVYGQIYIGGSGVSNIFITIEGARGTGSIWYQGPSFNYQRPRNSWGR